MEHRVPMVHQVRMVLMEQAVRTEHLELMVRTALPEQMVLQGLAVLQVQAERMVQVVLQV